MNASRNAFFLYRDDLTHDTNGLTSGIGEEVTTNGKHFAIHFIRPSSIVAKDGDAVWNIDVVGIFERFTIVQRFQGGDVGAITFDQIGQFVEQRSTG